jgi:hypothetical protein
MDHLTTASLLPVQHQHLTPGVTSAASLVQLPARATATIIVVVSAAAVVAPAAPAEGVSSHA